MYTRSYPRQGPKNTPPSPESSFNIEPAKRILNENDIPEGYSGTTILREKETEKLLCEEAAEHQCDDVFSESHRHLSHARRLKTATKVTPSLLRTKEENGEEKASCDCEEHGDACLFNSTREYAEEGCECDEPCDTKKERGREDRDHESTEDRGGSKAAIGRRRRSVKKRKHPVYNGKSCVDRSPECGLRDRCFSIEDLLLGGLILLMLNEGADDDIILILGFLLFSSL